jgi:hypothetical protein
MRWLTIDPRDKVVNGHPGKYPYAGYEQCDEIRWKDVRSNTLSVTARSLRVGRTKGKGDVENQLVVDAGRVGRMGVPTLTLEDDNRER